MVYKNPPLGGEEGAQEEVAVSSLGEAQKVALASWVASFLEEEEAVDQAFLLVGPCLKEVVVVGNETFQAVASQLVRHGPCQVAVVLEEVVVVPY